MIMLANGFINNNCNKLVFIYKNSYLPYARVTGERRKTR